MEQKEIFFFLRIALTIMFLLLVVADWQFANHARDLGLLFVAKRWTAVLGIGIFAAVVSLAVLATTWTNRGNKLALWFNSGLQILRRRTGLNLVLFGLLIFGFSFLIFGPLGLYLSGSFARLALFWLAFLLGSVFLAAANPARSWQENLIASCILTAAGIKIGSFLPEISLYPFSFSWSDTGRYYYASQFFAERIYGIPVPPSPLHPSRYLMQAVPFLIPGLPLLFHRLWQVLLWIALPMLTVHLLYRRLAKEQDKSGDQAYRKLIGVIFMAWAFLFLFQGPVYYHLLVTVVIFLWGFDRRRFWWSLGIVSIASAWAGISRINWIPVPGMLAMTLYFLETSILDGSRVLAPILSKRVGNPPDSLSRSPDNPKHPGRIGAISYKKNHPAGNWWLYLAYFLKPVTWFCVGVLFALFSKSLYIYWSGLGVNAFTSSFSSDLLWYRLLPNPTFPLGILPGVLLVSTPLLVYCAVSLRVLHPLRILGLSAILLVLFVGGVVVSTKIGGGSNLHNMDAFLVTLLLIGGYSFFKKFTREDGRPRSNGSADSSSRLNISQASQPIGLVFTMILLVPVVFAVVGGRPYKRYNRVQAEQTLATLSEFVHQAVQQDGKVLFISQRHLLTFGMLKEVPLVPEYENIYLMEMVMSGNQNYLDAFYHDIRERRFALIVTDTLPESFMGREFYFGEENDLWVERVSYPLLESYQRKEWFHRFGIEVLEPKPIIAP